MRRVVTLLVFMALLLGSTAAGVSAQDASPAATPAAESELLAELGYPELELTTDGASLDVPTELEAGRYHMTLTNTGSDLTASVELFQLPEGITQDDLVAALEQAEEGGIPDWFFEMVSGGGISTAPAGGSDSVVLDLTPGEWIFNLYAFDDMFSTEVNDPTTITVTGEMPELDDPDADVEAAMIDYDFQMPDTIPAGANVWKVENEGTQPHHLIINQVPEGTTEDQVVELVAALFGPPASPEAGASPVAPALSEEDIADVYETLVLSTGLSIWAEVELDPGTYVALCFIPAPDGTPHIMLGMVEIFTVE